MYLTSAMRQKVRDGTITEIKIDKLVYGCPTQDKTLNKLFNSIPKDGLINPILIHRYFKDYRNRFPREMTGDSYWGKKFEICRQMNCGDEMFIICTGNNRVEAARQLGYTSIDCIVFEDFNKPDIKALTAAMVDASGHGQKTAIEYIKRRY